MKRGKPLKESTIEIRLGEKVLKKVTPDKKGFFDLDLEYDKEYTLAFIGPDKVTELVYINTKGLDSIEKSYAYEYQIKIRLRTELEGIDYKMFKEPVVKISFDHDLESFVRDETYDAEVEKRMDDLRKQMRENGY